MLNLQLVTTADGSKTIYNAEVGENYHSRHGALQESQHVFLNSGLRYYLAGRDAAEVNILEIGFGTGLNFLLSADFCTGTHITLHYTGIEAYPLNMDMLGQTGYEAYISPSLWQSFLQHYEPALHQETWLNPATALHIAATPLLGFASAKRYDVIYFDAFASTHQPEMWNEKAITHTLQYLKPGGVFVTYAITGNLKRIVKSLGLKVEKAPGAPGKREMLRAVK